MIISYSDNTNDLELAGNENELLSFSESLLKGNTEILQQQENLDPSPYSRFLEKFQIKIIPESSVEIKVKDSCLQIEGSEEKLTIFAEVIKDFSKDGDKNDHLHIEYFDGHFYLSPKSTPLVVSHL